MRFRFREAAVLVALTAVAHAGVAVTVGEREVSVEEVQRLLNRMPGFQQRTLGPDRDAAIKNFVQAEIVRPQLYELEARARKLDEREAVRERIRVLLRKGMIRALQAEASAAKPITPEDIATYYMAHQEEYVTPMQIQLWRILVPSKERAVEIITKMKAAPDFEAWKSLAREESLDKVTHLRGGSLGFVKPDGRTSDESINVSPALYKAASEVKDGELVPEPVAEGAQFAVVWKRETQRPTSRTLAEESVAIGEKLLAERAKAHIGETLATLRRERVRDVAPEALEILQVTSEAEILPRKRPGVVRKNVRTPEQAPTGSPSNLR